ncbi:uncharacterized protein LOC132559426 [Ylistrum balloti]|uniref:uncharacterized protein LOC132559426 n=1 Tax=Ylistrum balloti TaxID=509963 RepID=UPI002905D9AA|nr:uncharacterized protein LOC132559426 [Ylistrum balloti]
MACCRYISLLIKVLGFLCCGNCMDVTMSDSNVTWEHANQVSGCRLAGLDETGKFNITNKHVLNQTGPLDAWIGVHVRSPQWVNITGCFHYNASFKNGIRNESIDISNDLNPVKACLGKCSSSEFAITKTTCYCLGGRTYTRGHSCPGHVCGHRNDSLCGNNTCVCGYRQFNPGNDLSNNGNCMTLTKNNNRYEFIPKHCSSNHTFVCSNTNQNNLVVYGTGNYGNWNNALAVCAHNKQLLSGLDKNNTDIFTTTRTVIQNNTSYWIGMYKLQRFDWRYNNIGHGQCPALHISSEKTLWKLRLRNCSTRLPVLCEQNDNNNFSKEPFSPDQTSSNLSLRTTPLSVTDIARSSSILLPIIGTSVTLVIAVVIIAVICLIKRHRERENERSDNSVSHKRENMSPKYDEIDVSQINAMCSDVLDNVGKTEANGSYTYNHLNSVRHVKDSVNDVYDHTGDFCSQYDSFGKEDIKDDQAYFEYDHIKTTSAHDGAACYSSYDTLEQLR